MNRKLVTVGLNSLASVAFAAPARAEGSWRSYWWYVLTGKDTRTWTDSNGDTNDTITKFRYCAYAAGAPYTLYTIQTQLTYENTWTPDENMSSVVYSCNTSTWQQYNYGRVEAGKYHVTLMKVNGTTKPPAYVNVGSSSRTGISVSF